MRMVLFNVVFHRLRRRPPSTPIRGRDTYWASSATANSKKSVYFTKGVVIELGLPALLPNQQEKNKSLRKWKCLLEQYPG